MMIELCLEINMAARQGVSQKKIGWKGISSIIEFQQYFTQGLWTDSDNL